MVSRKKKEKLMRIFVSGLAILISLGLLITTLSWYQ